MPRFQEPAQSTRLFQQKSNLTKSLFRDVPSVQGRLTLLQLIFWQFDEPTKWHYYWADIFSSVGFTHVGTEPPSNILWLWGQHPCQEACRSGHCTPCYKRTHHGAMALAVWNFALFWCDVPVILLCTPVTLHNVTFCMCRLVHDIELFCCANCF